MGLILDRVKRYLKPTPRHAAVLWLLLLALVGATAWGCIDVYRSYLDLLRQEKSLSALRRTKPVRKTFKPSRADLEAQRQWIELRQELGFSWYPMFAALERTSSPDIALLEFVPDKVARRLTLHGAAINMGALVGYLAALSNETYFCNVYLSHQKKTTQNNTEVVAFEVRMQVCE